MLTQVTQVGKRGTITIPKSIRDQIGLVEGSILRIELTEHGVLLRPAITTPVKPEIYSAMRKAEFLLNNTIDAEDYKRARSMVHELGINPDDVTHDPPVN